MKSSPCTLPHCLPADEFHEWIRHRILLVKPNEYALVSMDYDNFNFINDLFSYDTGDRILYQLERYFSEQLEDEEYFSRVHADRFVFFVKRKPGIDLAERFLKLVHVRGILGDILPEHYNFVCSGGIIEIHSSKESIMSLLDKANFARKHAKGNHVNTFFYYSEQMSHELQWKKVITSTMEEALLNGEFEMYLQPKILIKENRLAGAEALVRWNSKQHGFIIPDRFIPILEQNGFILQLDYFMLEQACAFIRQLIEEGIPPFPISVNFSKLHIGNPKFVQQVSKIASQYQIPAKLIEIEFTESVLATDFDTLAQAVDAFKFLGFKVSLDDFGRAYSSLNYLKDLPLDIIKIDKEFLSSTVNTDKGRTIVSKIVEMIKSLRLICVMEGVETQEQVEFLENLSCDLGQGYFYSKPLSVPAFREFIRNLPGFISTLPSEQPPSLPVMYTNETTIDSWDFYTLANSIDMGLLKVSLREDLSILYTNHRLAEYLGYSYDEFRQFIGDSVTKLLHEDGLEVLRENIRLLTAQGRILQFPFHMRSKTGRLIIFQACASCVLDSEGQPVALYTLQNVTDELRHTEVLKRTLEEKIIELKRTVTMERRNREALRQSEERYRLILEQSDDVMYEWDFETDSIHFSEKFTQIFSLRPIEHHISNNPALRAIVHPEDLSTFQSWIACTYKKVGVSRAEFRLKVENGKYIWVRIRSTAICDEQGVSIKAVGVISNIDQRKNELTTLTMRASLDPLTNVYNKGEIQNRVVQLLKDMPDVDGAFFIFDLDNFKAINDNLGHQFGDDVLMQAANKIRHIFRDTDIIGRLGGDEFGVYMQHTTTSNCIQHKAEQLRDVLHQVFYGANGRYTISASIGIALYPKHGETFSDLYRKADIALYESKQKGKNCVSFYKEALTSPISDTRTPVEWSGRFLNQYFSGDLTFHIFEMLYETRDIRMTVERILEQLGQHFEVDRVYIFENSSDGLYTSNTYEWCEDQIASQMSVLQNLSTEDLRSYFALFNEEGVLICNDVEHLHSNAARTILHSQGIQSLVQCAIMSDGRQVGMVGFDACKTRRVWRTEEIAVLGYVARIISVFMLKNRLSQELVESYGNHAEMLDNLDGHVYVINTANYQLLYVNKPMQALGAVVGEKCHKVAFGLDIPCQNCPVKRLNRETPHAVEEIYSVLVREWVSVAASRLKWSGCDQAALVCCTDISKYKKDPPFISSGEK